MLMGGVFGMIGIVLGVVIFIGIMSLSKIICDSIRDRISRKDGE